MRKAAVPFAIAVVAFAAFFLLGRAVSHSPPSAFELSAKVFLGVGAPVALIFTASCWWEVLVTLGVGCIILAVAVPAWRTRAVFSVIVTLVAWQTSDAFKTYFMRPRPSHWVLHHEPSFAYPSGHAMFAVVVYWLWAYYVINRAGPRPLRLGVGGVLIAWGAAVIWSRLALGAHYYTDLIGGVLFGVGFVSVGVAIMALVAPRATLEQPLAGGQRTDTFVQAAE